MNSRRPFVALARGLNCAKEFRALQWRGIADGQAGCHSVETMKWTLAFLLLGLAPAAMAAQPRVPLYDSIGLNIGLNCQWKQKCMAGQQRAMKRALRYVKTQRPPAWRMAALAPVARSFGERGAGAVVEREGVD